MRVWHRLIGTVQDCPSEEFCVRLNSYINELPLQRLNRADTEELLCRLDVANRDKIIRYICQHLASAAASICIQHGLQIGDRIWTWYNMSINTDVASTRLKLASMFYCKGDLHLAADVLEDVQRRYRDKVQAICGCGRMDPMATLSREEFAESLNESTDVLASSNIAFCVRFLRQEVFCAPPILHFEMVRAVGNDIQRRDGMERKWMNWAVVDSRPFLHYLQYLTFRGLGIRHRQQEALVLLINSTNVGYVENRVFHPETAINLLAHCWEMENDPDLALHGYLASQAKVPMNNAANWHIRRLTGGH